MAFNDDKTYIIPSLLKSAYQACNSCKVQCYAYDSSIEIICQQAAFFGPFDCLMLAREIGVPFNHMYGIPSACSQAETNGQLECLNKAVQLLYSIVQNKKRPLITLGFLHISVMVLHHGRNECGSYGWGEYVELICEGCLYKAVEIHVRPSGSDYPPSLTCSYCE
ncbi:hypothetical protein QTP88_027262 [Uroleucon formosanum]